MSRKTKNVLICCGLAAVCVAALSLIFNRADATATPEAVSKAASSELVMQSPTSIPAINSGSGTSSAFVPSSGAVASAPLTVVSKPVSKPPKPTPPASSALTNKTKKPMYSSKPKAKEETRTRAATMPKKSGGNTAGDNDPVFGNKVGTGGQAIVDKKTSSDGDINKQVATMD